MNQLAINSATIGIVISILGFEIGVFLRDRYKWPIFNPLLVAIVFVIIVLNVFRIDYASYYASANNLSYFLTPATVCLAIPLYQQLELLKKHKKAIFFGVLSGVLTSLFTVWLLSFIFQLTHEEYVTLLPKSITTAIGMGLSQETGGYVTITVAVIIITGVLGNMFCEGICKIANITHPVAKGIAIGTSSHAIGTARAMQIGEIEGAMSSLSIVISGIITLVGAQIFVGFL